MVRGGSMINLAESEHPVFTGGIGYRFKRYTIDAAAGVDTAGERVLLSATFALQFP